MSENEQLQLPLKWDGIWDIPTIYANEMIISFSSGREFYLVFGEVEVPMLINRSADQPPEYVTIRSVARVALPPETMIKMATLINDSVNRFINRSTEIDVEETDDIEGEASSDD